MQQTSPRDLNSVKKINYIKAFSEFKKLNSYSVIKTACCYRTAVYQIKVNICGVDFSQIKYILTCFVCILGYFQEFHLILS